MKTWGMNWIDSSMRVISYLGMALLCAIVVVQMDWAQKNVSAGELHQPGNLMSDE